MKPKEYYYMFLYKFKQFISRHKRYEAVYMPEGYQSWSRRFDTLDEACRYISSMMCQKCQQADKEERHDDVLCNAEWMVWDHKLNKPADRRDE